jgi:hypothetical protein
MSDLMPVLVLQEPQTKEHVHLGEHSQIEELTLGETCPCCAPSGLESPFEVKHGRTFTFYWATVTFVSGLILGGWVGLIAG